MIFWTVIFWISVAGLAWPIIGYPVVLRLFSKQKFTLQKNNDPVTVLIACYNEAVLIAKKIENTLQVLGSRGAQIIVIDDGSTDATSSIVKSIQATNSSVTLLTLPRSGKNVALNAGFKQAECPQVVVSDANAFMQAGAIDFLLEAMHDPRVGGVRGKYQPISTEHTAATAGTLAYQHGEHRLFMAESERGMLINTGGVLQAWRKDAINADEDRTMTEDWDMALGVRAKGKLIYYEPRAVASKHITAHANELVAQNTRLVYGSIQTVQKYIRLLNFFHHGRLSMSFFSGKLIQILSPWLIGFLVLSLGVLATQPGFDWTRWLLGIVSGIAGLGLLSLLYNYSQKRLFLPILATLEYVAMTEIAAIQAWIKYIIMRGRNWAGWTPVQSVRQYHP